MSSAPGNPLLRSPASRSHPRRGFLAAGPLICRGQRGELVDRVGAYAVMASIARADRLQCPKCVAGLCARVRKGGSTIIVVIVSGAWPVPYPVSVFRSTLPLQITNGTTGGLIACDPQFPFSFANPAEERLPGFIECEPLGRPPWDAVPGTACSPPETRYRGAVEAEPYQESSLVGRSCLRLEEIGPAVVVASAGRQRRRIGGRRPTQGPRPRVAISGCEKMAKDTNAPAKEGPQTGLPFGRCRPSGAS